MNILKTIGHFFSYDWLRKLLALVLAIAIYASVYNQLQEERIFPNVPVSLIPSAGIYVPESTSLTVSVTVKGPAHVLNTLDPKSLAGQITIGSQNKSNSGGFSVSITPACFKPHNGCRVIKVNQDDIFHNFPAIQNEISKKVKVKVQVNSTALSRDYFIAQTKSIPEEIIVSGPEDVVNSITEIPTEEIKIQSLQTEAFEQVVDIRNNYPQINIEPHKVHVQCVIENMRSARSFKSLPVLIAGRGGESLLAAELQSPVDGVEVEVSGEPGKISSLKESDISVYVDTTGKEKTGIYNLQINCSVKNINGVRIDRVTPGEATVKIYEK